MTTQGAIAFSRKDAQTKSDPKPVDISEQLVARARQGDRSAFDRLVRLHERRVLAVAWRLLGQLEDAQDAAQEVFLRLYRYLDSFDASRSLSAWLYRVTVNVCHDAGRKRGKRELQWAEIADSQHVDPAPDPAARASLAEQQRIVIAGLARLSSRERAALVLRDIEGCTTREVAEILETSETTVRSHICRARVKIKKFRQLRLAGGPS